MSPRGERLRLRGGLQLPDTPADVAWSPDDRTLAVGLADGALLLIELARLERARRVPAHRGAVLALAWQKSGAHLVSSGQDGAVLLWDARTLSVRCLLAEEQWSEHLAFADRDDWLAVTTGRNLSLFDGQGEQQYRYAARGGAIAALAWRPRTLQVACVGNGGLHLHQPSPQSAAQEYPLHGECLTARFDPSGRLLAAGLHEGAVHLWDLAGGGEAQLGGYAAAVTATEWSASGEYLATASESTVTVWHLQPAGTLRPTVQPLRLRMHSERIDAIACRPRGPWLATAARDRRLLWWRIGAGDAPQDTHLLSTECSVLRFSHGGAHLAVGEGRGRLRIFDCGP